jgi:hypothetical protein
MLRELDVTRCSLTQSGMGYLKEFIKDFNQMPYIEKIILDGNNVYD